MANTQELEKDLLDLIRQLRRQATRLEIDTMDSRDTLEWAKELEQHSKKLWRLGLYIKTQAANIKNAIQAENER